jgi:hypothetical protein
MEYLRSLLKISKRQDRVRHQNSSMKTHNVSIQFEKPIGADESIALRELQDNLAESDFTVDPLVASVKRGNKDLGATLALTIAGLAISALGNLISAISLWGSKKNFSITFKSGNVTFTANSLTAKEARAIAEDLRSKNLAADIRFLVSRK